MPVKRHGNYTHIHVNAGARVKLYRGVVHVCECAFKD